MSKVERQASGMSNDASLVSRLESAERIHIIGGPGSGKSTLARQIGRARDLPVYALDLVAYEGLEFVERPPEDSAERAQELAALPRWVTEGIFVGWTEPLLERAEVIVWIDSTGWARAATRITARTARDALHEIKVRRGRERFLRFSDYVRNLRQLGRVLIASREYWSRGRGDRYPVTRWEVEGSLAAHAEKVLRLTDDREARRLLRSSGRGSSGVARDAGVGSGQAADQMQPGGTKT
jgi:adenylate kinase family enzyme